MKRRPTKPVAGQKTKKRAKPNGAGARQSSLGLDRVHLRLATFAVLLVVAFAALFSRLWFLQVLAADQYRTLARENRVRKVQSEPPRGRILDINGNILVDNRFSLSVTIDRQALANEKKLDRTLTRLSKLLGEKRKDLEARLTDNTISPYKPVPVASDVTEGAAAYLTEHKNEFPGVAIDDIPIREYPQGKIAAQILGYVGQINSEELDPQQSDFSVGARPPYQAGDLVGRSGLERSYDRQLRGTPEILKVIVNSVGNVIGKPIETQQERPGYDLITSIDSDIQRLTENALRDGILANRAHFQAPAGAVVVMDPTNGHVVAMASYPTYDPAILADGFSLKEQRMLGGATKENPDDDSQLNRTIQTAVSPGSTMKAVTAGAALSLGVLGLYDVRDCPSSAVYPPDNPPGATIFNNYGGADRGLIGIPTSLETSCDTFYYQLGWEMESRYGPPESAGGDGTDRFQRYARTAGLGDPTGIDLPYETSGRVPDIKWCKANADIGYCPEGWVPGYTINMAIGQGDLIASPLQMAVTYSAIANGGTVWEPRIGVALGTENIEEGTTVTSESTSSAMPTPSTSPTGTVPSPTATGTPDSGVTTSTETSEVADDEVVREFKSKKAAELPLDDTEIGVIQEGLEGVVSGANGTATSAFAGFPLDRFGIAGKTGTAEIAETGLNDSWFVSYGPTQDPRYVIAVFVQKAGFGGETAAPIARQIWEGIAAKEGVKGVDADTGDVTLGTDTGGF